MNAALSGELPDMLLQNSNRRRERLVRIARIKEMVGHFEKVPEGLSANQTRQVHKMTRRVVLLNCAHQTLEDLKLKV